jgi:hypothetical protein
MRSLLVGIGYDPSFQASARTKGKEACGKEPVVFASGKRDDLIMKVRVSSSIDKDADDRRVLDVDPNLTLDGFLDAVLRVGPSQAVHAAVSKKTELAVHVAQFGQDPTYFSVKVTTLGQLVSELSGGNFVDGCTVLLRPVLAKKVFRKKKDVNAEGEGKEEEEESGDQLNMKIIVGALKGSTPIKALAALPSMMADAKQGGDVDAYLEALCPFVFSLQERPEVLKTIPRAIFAKMLSHDQLPMTEVGVAQLIGTYLHATHKIDPVKDQGKHIQGDKDLLYCIRLLQMTMDELSELITTFSQLLTDQQMLDAFMYLSIKNTQPEDGVEEKEKKIEYGESNVPASLVSFSGRKRTPVAAWVSLMENPSTSVFSLDNTRGYTITVKKTTTLFGFRARFAGGSGKLKSVYKSMAGLGFSYLGKDNQRKHVKGVNPRITKEGDMVEWDLKEPVSMVAKSRDYWIYMQDTKGVQFYYRSVDNLFKDMGPFSIKSQYWPNGITSEPADNTYHLDIDLKCTK